MEKDLQIQSLQTLISLRAYRKSFQKFLDSENEMCK